MNKHDKEAHLRSILKAVSYRLLAACATATIVFVFTGKVVLSLSIASVEAIAKICCYYVHERLWSFISFGKGKHPLSSIPIDRPLEEKDMEEIKKKLKELGYLSED
jgi:uncharacterized membrane protein